MKNNILILDSARVMDVRAKTKTPFRQADTHRVKFSSILELAFTRDIALVDSIRKIKNIL